MANTTKSAAQRKAEERQRYRDAGRVVIQFWIHPDDRARLANYVKRINKRYRRD